MKHKTNARQMREAEKLRRKDAFSPARPSVSKVSPEKETVPKPNLVKPEVFPDRTPEEDTREFLAYLDRYGVPSDQDDAAETRRRKRIPSAAGAIPRINLEDGMPLVEEAVRRMHMGIQEMKVSRVKVVKLIHGYGSTGRGGKIRIGIRNELATMQRRGLIRNYIPGEEFGPLNAAARKLTNQDKSVSRDADYGRMNHGITIVVL